MLNLGKWNDLTIVRFTDHGAYLDNTEGGEILMPKAYVRDEMKPGDRVHVFVYHDQSGRLVATQEKPAACVGQFARLRVAWTNTYGAFLDWGLMKDLFVPFREQRTPMKQDEWHNVFIYIDRASGRIVATSRVEKHLFAATPMMYRRGDDVEIFVLHRTPMGYKVIIDNAHAGMIYENQVHGRALHAGERLSGAVTAVREDGKLDVVPGQIGPARFRNFADMLLDELDDAGGFLPFGDHTPADVIARRFGVSKKTFKQALGSLYRNRRIVIADDGIRLPY